MKRDATGIRKSTGVTVGLIVVVAGRRRQRRWRRSRRSRRSTGRGRSSRMRLSDISSILDMEPEEGEKKLSF